MPRWRGPISGSESYSGIRLRVAVEPGYGDQTHVAQREAAIATLRGIGIAQMLNFANDHMRTVDFQRVMFSQKASDL